MTRVKKPVGETQKQFLEYTLAENDKTAVVFRNVMYFIRGRLTLRLRYQLSYLLRMRDDELVKMKDDTSDKREVSLLDNLMGTALINDKLPELVKLDLPGAEPEQGIRLRLVYATRNTLLCIHREGYTYKRLRMHQEQTLGPPSSAEIEIARREDELLEDNVSALEARVAELQMALSAAEARLGAERTLMHKARHATQTLERDADARIATNRLLALNAEGVEPLNITLSPKKPKPDPGNQK